MSQYIFIWDKAHFIEFNGIAPLVFFMFSNLWNVAVHTSQINWIHILVVDLLDNLFWSIYSNKYFLIPCWFSQIIIIKNIRALEIQFYNDIKSYFILIKSVLLLVILFSNITENCGSDWIPSCNRYQWALSWENDSTGSYLGQGLFGSGEIWLCSSYPMVVIYLPKMGNHMKHVCTKFG